MYLRQKGKCDNIRQQNSKRGKGKRDEKQEAMDIWGNHPFDCDPESYF